MDEQEQKITFQVAADIPLPVRVTVAPGGVNRKFSTRGPQECTAAEWKQFEKRVCAVPEYEETEVDGRKEKVIVGRRTVRIFERVAAPGESKLRPFIKPKQDDGEKK